MRTKFQCRFNQMSLPHANASLHFSHSKWSDCKICSKTIIALFQADVIFIRHHNQNPIEFKLTCQPNQSRAELFTTRIEMNWLHHSFIQSFKMNNRVDTQIRTQVWHSRESPNKSGSAKLKHRFIFIWLIFFCGGSLTNGFHPGISPQSHRKLIVESYSLGDLVSCKTILGLHLLPDGANYLASIWLHKLPLSFDQLNEAPIITNYKNGSQFTRTRQEQIQETDSKIHNTQSFLGFSVIQPSPDFSEPLGKRRLQILEISWDLLRPSGLHHLDESDTRKPFDESTSLHSMDMYCAPLYSSLHSMDGRILFNSKVQIIKLLDNNLASVIHSTDINPTQSYSSLHSMDSSADDLGIHSMEVPVKNNTKKRKEIASNHAQPVTVMAGISLPHPSKAPKSTALATIDHNICIKVSYRDKPVSLELSSDKYEWCKPLALTSRDRLNQLPSTACSTLAVCNWSNLSPSTEINSQYSFGVSAYVVNLQLIEKVSTKLQPCSFSLTASNHSATSLQGRVLQYTHASCQGQDSMPEAQCRGFTSETVCSSL